MLKKPDLLTIDHAMSLSGEGALQYYSSYVNPGMAKMMSMLGFSTARPVRAEGAVIELDDGRKLLDFTGGVGVLNHGHNHPRILEARRRYAEQRNMEVWKFFPSPYQTTLCANIARLLPEDLDVTFLCNSGAEANEGAMKLAEKAAGPRRDMIVYTDISFHGKSHATLSVSGSEEAQNKHFKLLPGCVKVPHGDAGALERAFRDNKSRFGKTRVCAFIVEPIRSEGVITPPEGYLQRIRQLCDEYDVTLIFDEVYTGWGRTGKLFAFEHYGAVPDVLCYSKSFGGGKATLAGFTARKSLFDKAYGSMKDATLHSTTFSGFSEECISAIEALNVLYDEGLIDQAAENGAYLLQELRKVQANHPKLVKDVRAVGYLSCVRLESQASKLASLAPGGKAPAEVLTKLTTGGVITAMFEKHDILTFSPPHDSNLLLLTPSLVVTKEQIDRYVAALDDVLRIGLFETAQKYFKRALGQ